MARKIFDIHNDLLVLFGIWFAIRFIYTKEIYIQVNGYTVNTLSLLILTIALVAINRAREKDTSEEIKSIK
ncbi:hypothetical protein [Metabacillus rhizolycopersici]|uniref:Uncharacterized protein n=1 Tax=Metabacillus rhizolycopersici TaxID=2875709 RepID=A0ABS7UZH7_9BACI|nr:hypothetical protein [Metabacillus rhizolycopersici]MBZ5753447.1 hypothetical protein [Metabacillus rhizolycopersici]